MSARRGSFAVASRLARREVRRHPWRHLLVVGLIYLPVVAALACFSAVATWHGQEQQKVDIERPAGGGWAFCCATTTGDGRAALEREITDRLPDDARVEPWRAAADWLVTDMARHDGRGPELIGTEVVEAAPDGPAAPRFVIDDGRLPTSDDEIFLTDPVARAGGWSVGDAVPSVRADRPLRVVGTGVYATNSDHAAAAVADQPDSYWRRLPMDLSSIRLADGELTSTETMAEVAVWPATDGALVITEDAFGMFTRSSAEVDRRVGPGLTLASAAVCAVVAVVASAAFAIASRRQLRSVGLLATVGTDPTTIRTAMVLQGAIPGLLAGVAAVLTGVVVVTVVNATDLFERATKMPGAQLQLSWSGAAIAVLLALAAGVAAAWQPARTLSRIPTLSALAGRRPQRPVPAGIPTAGLILWAVGFCLMALAFGQRGRSVLHEAQPFLIIGGIATIAIGAVGIAPLLVAGLEPLARHRRGTSRLALRSLSRHRTQSAATVAALAVALAIPVGLLTTRNTLDDPIHRQHTASSVATAADGGQPVVDPDGVTASVRGDLRSERATRLVGQMAEVLGPDTALIRTVALPSPSNEWHLVAQIDEDDAARVLEPWAADAIAEGHAIAFRDGPSHIPVRSDGKSADLEVVRSPSGALASIDTSNVDYLVGTAALGGVGSSRPLDSVIAVRPAPATSAERQALRELAGWDSQDGNDQLTLAEIKRALANPVAETDPTDAAVYLEYWDDSADRTSPPEHSAQDLALAGATAAALLLAVLVLTITLSLRNVDGEADQRAALAAGVAPATLRRQRAREGVVLALLAALLALPLGWLPVQAARLGIDTTVPHTIDGQEVMVSFASPGWLAIPVLLVPALVAAIAWTAVPAMAEAVRRARHRGPGDLVAPRW